MSRPYAKFVNLILLLIFVLGGTAFWWSLRSSRLAHVAQSPILATPKPIFTTILVDSAVSFRASEAEVSTSVQNFPDFSPLPTSCQPFKNLSAYSAIAVDQAESVTTWDTATVTTSDPEKLKRVLGLSEALDALVGMADLNSSRLPLQGKWEQQSLLAWNDPDCLTTIPDVSPVLIKKVALPNIDQAWYLESFEGTGAVELPVTRRVFLRQGSRWVVVSEVKSAQQELGSDAEAMLDRLETTCKPSRDERPDVVACATQIWFGEYRKPEVADQWMREMLTRLQW